MGKKGKTWREVKRLALCSEKSNRRWWWCHLQCSNYFTYLNSYFTFCKFSVPSIPLVCSVSGEISYIICTFATALLFLYL
jgi:hypothetical protein